MQKDEEIVEEQNNIPAMPDYQKNYDEAYQRVSEWKYPTHEETMAAWKEAEAAGTPALQFFQSVYQRPQPKLTPQQENKARLGAGIADSLSLLAEVFANSRGAYVRDRDPNVAQKTTAQTIKEYQNKFAGENDKYNNGLYGAQITDYDNFLKNFARTSGTTRENLIRDLNIAKSNLDKDNDRKFKEAQQQARLNAQAARQRERQNYNLYLKKTYGNGRPTELVTLNFGGVDLKVPKQEFTSGAIYQELYGDILTFTSAQAPVRVDKRGNPIQITPNDIKGFVNENVHNLPASYWQNLANTTFAQWNTPQTQKKSQKTTKQVTNW